MTTKSSFDASRRAVVKGFGALGASALALSNSPFALAQSDPAAGIPEVTLRWGALPFTNHAWPVLASRKGFLKDVGITMTGGDLPGTPRIINEKQVIPM